MDRFTAMTAFVTVADLRGFAPAARRLGMSAPAVTRLVAALENELSIRLLTRTTRSVALTDAGVRYLERARRILSDLAEAEQRARAEQSEPRGRFVIAAPLVFGRSQVSPLVCELAARHRALRVELTLADRMVSLVEEGIDAAVRIGDLDDSSLRVRTVGGTRRVVVGSPSYFEKTRRPKKLQQLREHALVQFTSLHPTPEWQFVQAGETARVPLTPAFVTNSADAAIAYATRGLGLAMVLSYQVREAVRAKALEVVLARFEPPPLPIQVVYPSSRLESASLRAFLELVKSTRSFDFTDV